jgi:phage terminase large subunit-like protein
VIGRCVGEHVLGKEIPEPPVEWWVVCASYKQSVAIQQKTWDMLPKHALAETCKFSKRHGFGANQPMVEFSNGSVIRFRTTNQDVLDLAGATLDGVLFDEPPRNHSIYAEVRKRLMETGGPLLMTLTPINAPTEWLQEEIARGVVDDLWFPLKPEYCIPVGKRKPLRRRSGEVCDEAWVQQLRDDEPPWEAPIRLDGHWENREGDRRFSAFVDALGVEGSHVVRSLPDKDLRFVLGIDHGETGNNQAFFLLGVDEGVVNGRAGTYNAIGIDEHVSESTTTVQQDAIDVLNMLSRNGLTWADLAYVGGDNPTSGKTDRKDNLRLMEAIVRELARRDPPQFGAMRTWRDLQPRIHSVKRGQQSGNLSKRRGERWLDKLIVANGLEVHECCVRFRECMRKYDGTRKSEYKHLPDACRYALNEYIKGKRSPSRAQIAYARSLG